MKYYLTLMGLIVFVWVLGSIREYAGLSPTETQDTIYVHDTTLLKIQNTLPYCRFVMRHEEMFE